MSQLIRLLADTQIPPKAQGLQVVLNNLPLRQLKNLLADTGSISVLNKVVLAKKNKEVKSCRIIELKDMLIILPVFNVCEYSRRTQYRPSVDHFPQYRPSVDRLPQSRRLFSSPKYVFS